MKFRFKSLSTYVYFLLWLTFSFLCIASESFGPIGNSNGKILLNSALLPIRSTTSARRLFGIIVIAAIFGTSILRDFQRDTYQILFTQPISKFAYLGGRWAGSFVTTVFAFSGMMLGTFLGTFAPWADHTRIGPNHLWTYLQPFLSVIVGADILHRLRILSVCGADPQDLHCLSAGRRAVHALRHWHYGLFGDAVAGALLVGHFRSHRFHSCSTTSPATGR